MKYVDGMFYMVRILGLFGEKDAENVLCRYTKENEFMDISDGLCFAMDTKDKVNPYWLQCGDLITYAGRGNIVITDIRYDTNSGYVADICYPDGTFGFIRINDEVRENVIFH